ncbi:MAG: hypothetical protein DI533_01365 [Cereibacter sphaeroides]|uniref:DUF1344 domain-containing protein n=1 Tax=Cereibacter sphaeroides TaxID=1063 RepID=A0A2W5SES1_CERSP|nr:MAG: hypothetical protein DI533_01365 [Cereibacter sphaeroides]
MRSFILPVAVIATLGFGQLAMANTITTGVVKSIDQKTMMLTLDNGASYQLPKGFKADSLKVGEKVAVNWVMQGQMHDATSVLPAK